MLRRIWQGFFFIAFKLRLYFIWSHIYRFLFERKYRNEELRIPLYDSLERIELEIAKMRWRPDAWFALWDAISYPQTAWIKMFMGKPAGDCDDISLAAAAAYEKYIRVYARNASYSAPLMLSVVWLNGFLPTGHNVCVFSYRDSSGQLKWAHWSNWHGGKIQYGFDSIENIVYNINDTAICAAVWKPTLELIEIKFLPGLKRAA